MRLIDADELMKHAGNCYDEQGHLLYAVGTGNIMAAKTIDAAPVVRCKDCKYYRVQRGHCITGRWDLSEDDFCSLAERSEDD